MRASCVAGERRIAAGHVTSEHCGEWFFGARPGSRVEGQAWRVTGLARCEGSFFRVTGPSTVRWSGRAGACRNGRWYARRSSRPCGRSDATQVRIDAIVVDDRVAHVEPQDLSDDEASAKGERADSDDLEQAAFHCCRRFGNAWRPHQIARNRREAGGRELIHLRWEFCRGDIHAVRELFGDDVDDELSGCGDVAKRILLGLAPRVMGAKQIAGGLALMAVKKLKGARFWCWRRSRLRRRQSASARSDRSSTCRCSGALPRQGR